MALSHFNIFEINSGATASNVNGGGFNPGNANMMTDLAATSATGNTPSVTSATYTFVAGDVGHYVYIKSGTDWTPGWYPIASVTGGAATLSAAVGQAEQEITTQRIGANTVAGCATVASPTGGTFTIDYSRSTASPFASTDLVIATTTTLTSAANPFTLAMVGNLIHITAGTGFTVGWYEIVSVTGITATVDSVCGTLASTGGTGKVGGAISLGGANDDAVFELGVALANTGASRYYIKGGATYTLGGTVTIAADGAVSWLFRCMGYSSIRGDSPTGTSRPTIACGATVFTSIGNYFSWEDIIFTGTASKVFAMGAANVIKGVKITNSSATANRSCTDSTTTNTNHVRCEFISYRGDGSSPGGTQGAHYYGCVFHDSNRGIATANGNNLNIFNCLFYSNVTAAIDLNSSVVLRAFNNTLYGAENKLGVGLDILSGVQLPIVIGNIFYGFETGVVHADTQTTGNDDFNNYYNNTNDVSSAGQWQKGANDIALDPAFTSVQQRTGSTATTSAANVFTQSGATFQTWGVTAGTHYIRVVSGTGVTAGIYGIASVDSETQLTLDITITADATADKVWSITTGLNWAVGTNMKAAGFPGAFPGTSTTGYMDIGAVQRQEAGAAGMLFIPNMEGS